MLNGVADRRESSFLSKLSRPEHYKMCYKMSHVYAYYKP